MRPRTGGQMTHDMTHDDYSFTPRDGGQTGSVASWNNLHPHTGDFLLLRNGDRSTRYQVVGKVDHCWNVDPATMWIAQVKFAPRSEINITPDLV